MILNTGKVYTFGDNTYGKLGLENLSDTSGQLIDNSGYISNNCILTSNGLNHSLFLLNSGKLVVTGSNQKWFNRTKYYNRAN